MPLDHGYGVLLGTIQNYYRDPPDDYGRYYHGNLILSAPAGSYHCAIDVDSHQSNVGVEWRTFGLRASDISTVLNLGVGYHGLASSPTSGALDYIRSEMFIVRVGCLRALLRFIGLDSSVSGTWKKGTSIQALTDLEPLINTTRTAGLMALVYGEPFTDGLGMHNVHQNQGDPIGSQWSAEDGIWQDGCTILQQDADNYTAFMNKFTSQSYTTDDQGRPV